MYRGRTWVCKSCNCFNILADTCQSDNSAGDLRRMYCCAPSMYNFPNKFSIIDIYLQAIENRQYLVNMKTIIGVVAMTESHYLQLHFLYRDPSKAHTAVLVQKKLYLECVNFMKINQYEYTEDMHVKYDETRVISKKFMTTKVKSKFFRLWSNLVVFEVSSLWVILL